MKNKKCFHCGAQAFRRINRTNFFQRVILTWFGYYPWECAMCRRKSFFRNSGRNSGEPL